MGHGAVGFGVDDGGSASTMLARSGDLADTFDAAPELAARVDPTAELAAPRP